jgi:hypothetical protein
MTVRIAVVQVPKKASDRPMARAMMCTCKVRVKCQCDAHTSAANASHWVTPQACVYPKVNLDLVKDNPL